MAWCLKFAASTSIAFAPKSYSLIILRNAWSIASFVSSTLADIAPTDPPNKLSKSNENLLKPTSGPVPDAFIAFNCSGSKSCRIVSLIFVSSICPTSCFACLVDPLVLLVLPLSLSVLLLVKSKSTPANSNNSLFNDASWPSCPTSFFKFLTAVSNISSNSIWSLKVICKICEATEAAYCSAVSLCKDCVTLVMLVSTPNAASLKS